MDLYYSPRFSRRYKKLPAPVKDRVEAAELLLRRNPFHPRLKTHKLDGWLKGLWASSVDEKYRIIFEFYKKDIIRLHSVGDHSIYEQIF